MAAVPGSWVAPREGARGRRWLGFSASVCERWLSDAILARLTGARFQEDCIVLMLVVYWSITLSLCVDLEACSSRDCLPNSPDS